MKATSYAGFKLNHLDISVAAVMEVDLISFGIGKVSLRLISKKGFIDILLQVMF